MGSADSVPLSSRLENVQFFSKMAIRRALVKHTRSFCASLHAMSLHIDTKMILLWNCSHSQPKFFSNVWISWRIFNVVCPGKIIHSTSIGSPSVISNSLYCFEFFNRSSLFSHSSLDWENPHILPRHIIESENIYFGFREIDDLFVIHRRQLDTLESPLLCSQINF